MSSGIFTYSICPVLCLNVSCGHRINSFQILVSWPLPQSWALAQKLVRVARWRGSQSPRTTPPATLLSSPLLPACSAPQGTTLFQILSSSTGWGMQPGPRGERDLYAHHPSLHTAGVNCTNCFSLTPITMITSSIHFSNRLKSLFPYKVGWLL